MGRITVLRPDEPEPTPPAGALAERGALPEELVLTLIENGKPRAREVLERVADALQERFPQLSVEVFSKPSAGKPISSDEAVQLAARSHLVITGVGD